LADLLSLIRIHVLRLTQWLLTFVIILPISLVLLLLEHHSILRCQLTPDAVQRILIANDLIELDQLEPVLPVQVCNRMHVASISVQIVYRWHHSTTLLIV
jgi:hypothetical protein